MKKKLIIAALVIVIGTLATIQFMAKKEASEPLVGATNGTVLREDGTIAIPSDPDYEEVIGTNSTTAASPSEDGTASSDQPSNGSSSTAQPIEKPTPATDDQAASLIKNSKAIQANVNKIPYQR